MDSVWVKHCFKDRYDYYYNLETGEGTWEEPEGFQNGSHHLSKEEIQVLPSLPIIMSFSFFFNFWYSNEMSHICVYIPLHLIR